MGCASSKGSAARGDSPSPSTTRVLGAVPLHFALAITQDLDSPDGPIPPLPQRLFVSILEALLAAPGPPAALPVVAHAERLPSGKRGLSLPALRAIRDFYASRGALGKVMANVCKEEGFEASVCNLTASTGLSLAESAALVVASSSGGGAAVAAAGDVSALVGDATSFFSYSWTGTTLGDMLAAIERKVEALEAADGVRRFVWVDMFAASQNLLAGRYLPKSGAERDKLKRRNPEAYRARKEDTDTIFESAIDAVGSSGTTTLAPWPPSTTLGCCCRTEGSWRRRSRCCARRWRRSVRRWGTATLTPCPPSTTLERC